MCEKQIASGMLMKICCTGWTIFTECLWIYKQNKERNVLGRTKVHIQGRYGTLYLNLNAVPKPRIGKRWRTLELIHTGLCHTE